jgi:hypothetical protein
VAENNESIDTAPGTHWQRQPSDPTTVPTKTTTALWLDCLAFYMSGHHNITTTLLMAVNNNPGTFCGPADAVVVVVATASVPVVVATASVPVRRSMVMDLE